MADANKDDLLIDTNFFGLDIQYSKSEAAADVAFTVAGVAAGSVIPGAGNLAGGAVGGLRAAGMFVGRNILRNFFKKAATEGAEAAVEATAKAAVKAAAKETAEAAVKTVAREAAEETAEAAGKAGLKAAGAKITGETIAATSASLLSGAKTVASGAGTAASYAWKAGKVVTFPFRHPVTTVAGVGLAHQVTGGTSTEVAVDTLTGAWNMTKDHAPAVAEKAVDFGLYVGDGVTGAVSTVGQKGVEHLGEKLPLGTPLSLRAAVAGAETKLEEASKGEGGGLVSGLKSSLTAAKDKALETTQENADELGLDAPEMAPLRDMMGNFLGVDPKNLNARNLARMMRDFAGDNKLALGLGMYAAYTTEGGPLKKAVAGLVTTMVMSFMMPYLSKLLAPMMEAAGPALAKMRDHLGEKFDRASTTGQFNTHSYGLTAPDATPVQKPTAPSANDPVADFRNNGSMMTNPVVDTRKLGINPAVPSANRDQFALTVNG